MQIHNYLVNFVREAGIKTVPFTLLDSVLCKCAGKEKWLGGFISKVIFTPYGHLLLSPNDFRIFQFIAEIYFQKIYGRKPNYLPKDGDVIIDAGAHIGLYTLWASYKNPKVILALEPNPQTFKLLVRTLRLNRIKNVVPLNIALGAREGLGLFMLSKDRGLSHLVSSSKNSGEIIKVRTMTLKSLIELMGVPKIDILKMDIEGAEHEVVRGSLDILSRGVVGRIVMEVHGNVNQLIEILLKAKFKVDSYHSYNKNLAIINARYAGIQIYSSPQ